MRYQPPVGRDVRCLPGGAENAELDIAEPDNAAPYSKGGQRGTGQYGTV